MHFHDPSIGIVRILDEFRQSNIWFSDETLTEFPEQAGIDDEMLDTHESSFGVNCRSLNRTTY
jgi:hypothetical protein